MKKIYFVFLLFVISFSQAQTIYNGNAKTGFGGPLGTGKFTITNDATKIYISFNKGSGDLNDAVVIYFDSKTGGFASTTGFNDTGDGLRTATSGFQTASNKSILTFPSGFLADYAITFDKTFAAIFQLATGGANSFTYVNSANLTPTTSSATAPVYTLSFLKTDIGLGTSTSFKFLASYISSTAYRANEFIGETGPANNIAYTDYTATTSSTYNLTGTLPVSIFQFSGKAANNIVELSWHTSQELNVADYVVYRSGNGQDFSNIGTVKPSGNGSYSYNDGTPNKGNNYYKVMAVDKDGKSVSTPVINVVAQTNFVSLKAHGELSSNNLAVELAGIEKGVYKINLVNSTGQILFNKTINHIYDNTYNFQMPANIIKGIYVVSVIGNSLITSKEIGIK